jgi:hypothetical protein
VGGGCPVSGVGSAVVRVVSCGVVDRVRWAGVLVAGLGGCQWRSFSRGKRSACFRLWEVAVVVIDLFVVRVQEASATSSWVLRTHMSFFVSYVCLSSSSESVTSFVETKILLELRLLGT